MEATSTRAPWRYTCTLCHLGNLDTHHLKEHIAVTHLRMIKYQCSQCSLEVFTSDAMIYHQTECAGTYVESPALIGMKALDEFQRLCDEAIQREMNRKMEALRYFGSHLMAALQFNKESIGQQTSSHALNVSISSVSTSGISTHHNHTQSFDNNTADSSLNTPNLSVLSLNKDNSNSLSFASLNTSGLEPGEVVTPMKSKDSQGLMDRSLDERRRERSDSRSLRSSSRDQRNYAGDRRDRQSQRKSYHHRSSDYRPSYRSSPYRHHGSSRRSSRSPSRLSHSLQSSRYSPPLMKVPEEGSKTKDEATVRKENTFLTKLMFNQKEKIEQEVLAEETKETEIKRETENIIVPQEVHSMMNRAFNEPSMFEDRETTWNNSNEAMDVGRSYPGKNRLQTHLSNGFDRWKNVVFFEQCKSGFFGMPPPSTRQQFGFGGYPIGFGGNYRGPPPPMQTSPLPPQWQMPTEDVGYSPGVCPFHPRNVGHRVALCGSQIADLDQRMQVFRAGGGCQDLRCLKRHKDSCRSSTFCLRCQEPHHPLFCRLDQVRK